jgi:hypothetical protein
MVKLSLKLKGDNSFRGSCTYKNEVNASNFKEVARVLKDLKDFDLPIDKAIKEYRKAKSDWDAVLGI